MADLVCVTGPDLGRRFGIVKGMIRVGRKPRSEIFLRDLSVSRTHAIFRCLDQRIAIGDLKSRNGTFVNGKRIECFIDLADGDLIQVGRSLLRLSRPLSLKPIVRESSTSRPWDALARPSMETVCSRPKKARIRSARVSDRWFIAGAAALGFASVWLVWV